MLETQQFNRKKLTWAVEPEIGERFEVDDEVEDKSSLDSFGLFRAITDIIPWLVFRNLSFGSLIP